MTREKPALQDRRSVLKTATKAVGGLVAGSAVVGTASADYCTVVKEAWSSNYCFAKSHLDTQYVTITVDLRGYANPSGDIWGLYSYDCPGSSNYDEHEVIDSDYESMRIESWQADPGYGFTVDTGDQVADITIEECG